ncbi:MAG: DEAD/DEAH box helicase [Treponema sp.]|nr:DEAD/DEAH box helicase [Treponema sp.]
MAYDYNNPLIVQGDRTLLLDVHNPLAGECRDALIPFAELEKSPEHMHTYRLSSLSLWNAASAGFSYKDAIEVLHKYSKFEIPQSVEVWIEETASRFGMIRMVSYEGYDDKDAQPDSSETENSEEQKPQPKHEYLRLEVMSDILFTQLEANSALRKYMWPCPEKNSFALFLTDRGTVKQKLMELDLPVKDEVPLIDGEPLEINLKKVTGADAPLNIRDYQYEAAQAIVGDRKPGTGFGTIVLPCGAGKTIVGMTIMSMLKTNTLIVTTNITAVHQWIDELCDKTDVPRDMIGEYTGEKKTIKPITVATYQILTWRPDKVEPYPHFSLFRQKGWGLIIYDEVHLLPAPVFRVVAELQAVRRVGLTATLVREDGCQGHVFCLVGPKRYDVPWKQLEQSGWIAKAQCIEVRLDLDESKELEYAVAEQRAKHRIACENPVKLEVVQTLVDKFSSDRILVIGQYLDQLVEISKMLKVPIITGKTPTAERDQIYSDFKAGKIRVLVVSKVANFAVDLPDASMAIQVSGTFGSRQEEAQRLGRVLRKKERMARFFTLITRNTVEEDFGSNRQKFLAEQGYDYRIIKYNNPSSFDEMQEAIGEK